jgi:hypothetical protein
LIHFKTKESLSKEKNIQTIVNGGLKNSFWKPKICIVDKKLYWIRWNWDFLILDYGI